MNIFNIFGHREEPKDDGSVLKVERPGPWPPPAPAKLAPQPNAKEAQNTMISFKSIGHFFAKAFTAIKNDIPKVQATEGTVEAVTAVVVPQVVPIEKAAYAVLGEIASILTGADAAAHAKLADAGLDVAVIQKVEDLLKQFPQLIALAKAL